MEATTAPTTSHYNALYFLNRHNLYECRTCGASFFLLSQLDEHLPTHLTEGADAEGQETFSIPTPAAPAQDLDDPADELRWTRDYMDNWVVRGPARLMVEGATLTVTSRKGTKLVKLGPVTADSKRRWDSEPMAIAAPAEDERKAAPAEVPEGIHLLDGTAYKVVTSGQGRRYAKVLQGTKWVYDARAVRKLSAGTVATLEQAAEYGKLTGICACCGAELTNPESIRAGIGPICRSRL